MPYCVCWGGDAIVCRVSACGNVTVCGSGIVYGNAIMCGSIIVCRNAIVCGSVIVLECYSV